MKTALTWHIKEEQDPSLFDLHLERMKMNESVYFEFCKTHGFTKKNNKKTPKDFSEEIQALQEVRIQKYLLEGKSKKINLSKDLEKIWKVPELASKLSGYNHSKDFVKFLQEISGSVNLNFLLKKDTKFTHLDVLYRIFSNQNEWVRGTDFKKIKSKNKQRVLGYLIKHFFVKYKDFSHPCFLNLWQDGSHRYVFHMEVSKGESVVKSFKKNFSEDLTKKEILNLKDFPANFSYKDMILKTYVERYRGSDKLFRCLKFFQGNLNSQRFKDFINFMAKNEGFLDYSQVRPLWDYIEHAGILSFKGRSFDNLLGAMHEWHQDLSKNVKVKFESWKGSGLRGYEEIRKKDNVDTLYKVEEVLNSVDLKREGKEMKHCVFSYISRCKNGAVSIWALKEISEINKTNLLTIEVRDGAIVQVRGKCNRIAKDWEKKILLSWGNNEGLSYGGRY